MEKEICDLSCDPANPRRHEVPGPYGVKSATEDCAGVGNQAPVPVNATGKRYIQQTFHPSLFTRTRCSSLGNTPPLETTTALEDSSSDTFVPKPPDWQRIPGIRNQKRKRQKLQSPSPEKITTSNRFSELPLDSKEPTKEPMEKRPSKPPPIILYGVEDVNKLVELLESTVDKDCFTIKIVNRNQLRVVCVDTEIYKNVITLVRKKGLIGHTFNLKDQRCYRIVIKHLHHTTPHSAIKEEIEKTGNKVQGEIINSKFGPDKKPTSTFFINIEPGANNAAVKDIKYIYHQSVIIEDPKKRTTLPQCQRCQQYGHSKNYCMRPYRCVKCGQGHKTADCPKKDRNTPAKCALCQGAHPANYKGCEVYKEILNRRMARNLTFRTKTQVTSRTVPIDFRPQPLEKTQEKLLYSDVLKKEETQPTTTISVNNKLEELLIKQSEKFELILQQMSTLMSLIATLVERISK